MDADEMREAIAARLRAAMSDDADDAPPGAGAVPEYEEYAAEATRLLDGFRAEAEKLPFRVQAYAVLSALGGLMAGVLDAVQPPEAREWAYRVLYRRLLREGIRHGFVSLVDPGDEALDGEGAGDAEAVPQ